MSVQAMAWAFDHAPETLTHVEMLVLLSIANHADAEGDNAWPSLERIAKESRASKRRVQYAIGSLEEQGVLERVINDGGTHHTLGHLRPNRYRIIPMTPQPNDTYQYSGGARNDHPKGCSSLPKGVLDTSTQTINEPSTRTNPPTPQGGRATPAGPSEDALAIFEAWKEATKHPRAVLDKTRLKKIEDRLKDYSREELITAVWGVTRSAFHMGENPDRKKYDDITLILRDSAHVEQFANLELQARRRAEKLGGKDTWMDRSRPIEELT